MKIAFDIGGVISKYPNLLRELWRVLQKHSEVEIHVITDMHDKDDVMKQLTDNGFCISPKQVHIADYDKYGNMSKAMLLKELDINMLIDDFGPYLEWDSQLGPAPLRLMVMPDSFKPYWHESWKCSGGDFGRRVAPDNLKE